MVLVDIVVDVVVVDIVVAVVVVVVAGRDRVEERRNYCADPTNLLAECESLTSWTRANDYWNAMQYCFVLRLTREYL